jgi:hypothetical protein
MLEDVVEDSSRLTFRSSAPQTRGSTSMAIARAWFTGVCRFSVKPAKTVPQHRRILGTLIYSFYAREPDGRPLWHGGHRVLGSERG